MKQGKFASVFFWISSLGLLMVILSYYFIDKPVVFWAYHHHFRQYIVLQWLTQIPEVFSMVVLLLLLSRVFFFRKNKLIGMKVLYIVLSVSLSVFVCKVLKVIFSRYWPATWISDNLSLLRNGTYGFSWLHGGSSYASFPSGHAVMISAFMISIAFCYPVMWGISVLLINASSI